MVQVQKLGLTIGRTLKIYTILTRRLKLKVRTFWGLISAFVEVTGKKLVGREGGVCGFLVPPS